MYRPDTQKMTVPCHEYNACNRPVYFVRSQEYDPEYQRHYQEHEREREMERQRGKTANGMRSAVATTITTEDTDAGMRGTSGDTDMKAMNATINERCAAALRAYWRRGLCC